MRILVAIDDTDNIDSRGTGELASLLAKAIEQRGWGTTEPITRHQLLVHPDIPYTSHNSSMCFTSELGDSYLDEFIDYASTFLVRECAPGSDPGLCIACQANLDDPQALIAFGLQAKEEVLQKEDAYILAKTMGIHLSEHGGTGQGIIGALAGVGLRLSGNDGRLKGKLKIRSQAEVLSVIEIKLQTGVKVVKTIDGKMLADVELIRLGETLKAVYLENQATLLVCSTGLEGENLAAWQTCSKNQLRGY
ncbi:MAG TPA: hypothetical protein VN426_02835 [Syntrophomonadaceae bacterium]|nr:hypothetical protein [Syntrophomonadaceae bacterium]